MKTIATKIDENWNVYLTNHYFDEDGDGPDGRPSHLLHELMHLDLAGSANVFPKAEEAYNYDEALSLAADDPEAAKNNAQNYRYFYEEALFGPQDSN